MPKTVITPKATATACHAIRRCTLVERPEVRARKIGVIPGGSMMTKRVRNREPKTAASNTVRALRERVVRNGQAGVRARPRDRGRKDARRKNALGNGSAGAR